MLFTDRRLQVTNKQSQYSYSVQIPSVCPHCGVVVEARAGLSFCGRNVFIAFFTCTVPSCQKISFAVYLEEFEGARILNFLYMHPSAHRPEMSAEIKGLSPRCNELYTQAIAAESLGHFDLASCGYRNAIEALVKDYAIKYKGAAADEKLMRKSLQSCIMEYLDGLDEAVSAYMVKEFGNFATHYPQLGTLEFDFSEQRIYLEIFLRYMSDKIKILEIAATLPPKHLQKFSAPAQEDVPPPDNA